MKELIDHQCDIDELVDDSSFNTQKEAKSIGIILKIISANYSLFNNFFNSKNKDSIRLTGLYFHNDDNAFNYNGNIDINKFGTISFKYINPVCLDIDKHPKLHIYSYIKPKIDIDNGTEKMKSYTGIYTNTSDEILASFYRNIKPIYSDLLSSIHKALFNLSDSKTKPKNKLTSNSKSSDLKNAQELITIYSGFKDELEKYWKKEKSTDALYEISKLIAFNPEPFKDLPCFKNGKYLKLTGMINEKNSCNGSILIDRQGAVYFKFKEPTLLDKKQVNLLFDIYGDCSAYGPYFYNDKDKFSLKGIYTDTKDELLEKFYRNIGPVYHELKSNLIKKTIPHRKLDPSA